jgi:Nucleosome-binding factor SPN, POB3 subunit
MEETPQLLKGLNYGSYSFDKNNFIISKDGKHLLNVPLTKITNSSVFNKQDVALELQPDGQEG